VGGFQLCTLDLDGTLLTTTCFLEASKALGKEAEIRRLDEAYFAGAQTLRENFFAEFAVLEGASVEAARAAVLRGPWLAHIPDGVRRLRELGLQVGVLTDQPRFLAELAEPTLDPVLCSEGGTRDGKIVAAIEYREDKLASLRSWAKANKVELERVIHCGNGVNDVPVWERVGLGIAVNPSGPDVARRADLAVEGCTDLRQLAEVVERALREGM
jgi:phosphoserine phosphatase